MSCLEVNHNLLYDLPQKNQKIIDACDCPCDDLVEVESPPVSVMVLSYIAQAIVVTIVGLNMGFRYVRHCMQWISSIARVLRLALFVFWNVKPGRSTLIYGRKICSSGRNIKRQLRHNCSLFFRIMGQIQVLSKQAKLRREKWIATVPPHLLFCSPTHTNSSSSISK